VRFKKEYAVRADKERSRLVEAAEALCFPLSQHLAMSQGQAPLQADRVANAFVCNLGGNTELFVPSG